MILRSLPLLAALGLPASALCAQNSDSLQQALARAATQADDLQRDLPSFTCNVTGHSDVLHKGKLEHSTTFEASIRAQRLPDGRMVETNTFTSIDGKPATGSRHHPYFVHGGFTEVLTYVSGPRQACSSFTLGEGRIDFAAKDPAPPGCAQWRGLRGFLLLDGEGNITHIERTLPASDSLDMIVPFAAIDLSPVELKGKTYRLASHIVSDNVEGSITQHFDARYTGCKLFTTEIRILPGRPVDDPAPSPPQ